jgi:hypothetical protein
MARQRRKVKHEGGRYVAGDRSSSSLNAISAYAGSLSMAERRDVYVTEIGKPGWLLWCHYDPNDGATVIIPNKRRP